MLKLRAMFIVLTSLVRATLSFFKTQRELALENLALRHQIGVLKRSLGTRRVCLKPSDQKLWVVLSRLWTGWHQVLAIVQPATVIRWHRDGFGCFWASKFWASKSRRRDGRPELDGEVRAVFRSTVAKYMIRHRKPPSPTWRAFLDNHVKDLVSLDFFVVPTATFRVLFVLLILAHDRRRVLHFNVTSGPSAEWTAQQVVQAFPGDSIPRYLLRDRDCIYGKYFRHRVKNLGIEEALIAARSPWQNPYVERLIGSIRRECLNHVIVLNEQHLRRILHSYFQYYHRSRCHLSLEGDAPVPRSVQGPELGQGIELSEVGGLHHRYIREAA